MKSFLIPLSICLFIVGIGSKDVFSTDIEYTGDRIVSHLWNNIEVPEKDIKELFNLVEKEIVKEEDKNKKSNYTEKNVIDFIDLFKKLMINKNSNKSEKSIDSLISEVKKNYSQFSQKTIESSLIYILENY